MLHDHAPELFELAKILIMPDVSAALLLAIDDTVAAEIGGAEDAGAGGGVLEAGPAATEAVALEPEMAGKAG